MRASFMPDRVSPSYAIAFPTWLAITAPPAKTIGLNLFWPADRNPSPAAISVCVATRRRLILEERQRNSVHRTILHIQRSPRKRKNGVLIALNHHPAKLNACESEPR